MTHAPCRNDRIVVVDDDPGTIYLVGRILHGISDLSFATSGERALQLVRDAPPDLILLDAELPGMSGFKVFDAMKQQRNLSDVPVIFVTSHDEAGFEVSALSMGAADFIAKPFTSSRLLARVKNHLRARHRSIELKRAAPADPLTGVGGRRTFEDSLDREWRRCRRLGHPIALLLIDVDHLSAYNEHYGDDQGDACLRRIAQAVNGIARRPADCFARYEGKRFALLLPQTPRGGAQYLAQCILAAVDSLAIRHEGSLTGGYVTTSIGISCYDDSSRGWVNLPTEFRLSDGIPTCRVSNCLLRSADLALSRAKMAGYAQAQLSDVADLEGPLSLRDLAPIAREVHRTKWA